MTGELPFPPFAFLQCALAGRAWSPFSRSVDDIGYRFFLVLFVPLWCAIGPAPIYLYFEPIPMLEFSLSMPFFFEVAMRFFLVLIELMLLSIRFFLVVVR